MKRSKGNIENIDDVLGKILHSTPSEEMEAAGTRVLQRLRVESGDAVEAAAEAAAVLPKRSGRQVWRFAAAALLVSAVIVGGLVRHRRSETPEIMSTIGIGDVLRTNDAPSTIFALPDGSRIEMRAHSELSLERADDGLRVHLSNGGVIVNAAKQRGGGHLYVQTKDMTVSVIGTVFLVNAEETGSRVAVIEGEVRVQQGATLKKLLPGEQVATNPSMESHPVSEEISWSRNAHEHLALLEQAVVPPAAAAPQAPAEPREAFEVVSVRAAGSRPAGGRGGAAGAGPCDFSRLQIDAGRFAVSNVSLYTLITFAYGKDECFLVDAMDLLSGGPEWIRSALFDIQAVLPDGSPSYTRQQFVSRETPKLQAMLQAMLSDRFRLALHREQKEIPVYELRQGKDGSRLTPSKESDNGGRHGYGSYRVDPNVLPHLMGSKATIADLTRLLGLLTHRPVLDRTGITGEFTFDAEYSDDPNTPGPSIFAVLEDRLGLKLESAKAPAEVIVIDRAEKPSEN